MEKHELRFAVDAADIDELGHVNNVVYLRWVQDAAVSHWMASASPADQDALVWVVLRHEIDYRKPAKAGDGIVLRTWVGSATRLKFERLTEILRESDGVVLASARTLWCPLDRRTGRPSVVSGEVRERFSR